MKELKNSMFGTFDRTCEPVVVLNQDRTGVSRRGGV